MTHRAQERPAQFTRISFVQFGSIIGNARSKWRSISSSPPSIPREEVDRILQLGREIWSSRVLVCGECPRESWESGEERTKDLRKVVGRLSHRSVIMATYRSSGKGIIVF